MWRSPQALGVGPLQALWIGWRPLASRIARCFIFLRRAAGLALLRLAIALLR